MIGPAFPHVLVAAQGGDEQSFETLWRDLHPAMLRYLQVVAPAAAEDLAADTWMRVIGALSRFVGDEPGFRAWVFTVARHQALDWHRWVFHGQAEGNADEGPEQCAHDYQE
jgi:RNA polymerase sigma-70 factor (ECF subfamily)